ncbi:uncharacterized protein LOC123199970 isoform X5 [Mangifera indica]|uniref:uncharacterized protein LOC123199970 isoform X5 n=1 Tax=Mangifera indica TaxID=29780 RepID=UPI001CF9F63C|nr:uncharacterized protein LOC123199970 isoform X5 [Mangifera indica]
MRTNYLKLRYLMFLLRLCDLDLVDMKTCVFDLIIIYPKMRKMVCFHFWENMLDFVAINEVSQEGNLLVQHHLLFGSGEQQQTASISWGLITQVSYYVNDFEQRLLGSFCDLTRSFST